MNLTGRRLRSAVPAIGGSLAVLLWAAASLIALFVVILGSSKTTAEIVTSPLGIPGHLSIGNYRTALAGPSLGESFWTYTRNSCVASSIGVLVSMGSGTAVAAGLVFAPGGVRARELYYWLLLLTPGVVTWVPLFSLMNRLNLLSSPVGLGLVYGALGTPLVTLLMRGYFTALPADVVNAARLDGAGPWRVLGRIVIPMTAQQLFGVGFLIGLSVWSELALAIILLIAPSSQTLPVGLLQFRTEFSVQLGPQCAGMCLSLLPLLIAYAAWRLTAGNASMAFPIDY